MKQLSLATVSDFKHTANVSQAKYFLHKELIHTEYLTAKPKFYLGNPIVFKKQSFVKGQQLYAVLGPDSESIKKLLLISVAFNQLPQCATVLKSSLTAPIEGINGLLHEEKNNPPGLN